MRDKVARMKYGQNVADFLKSIMKFIDWDEDGNPDYTIDYDALNTGACHDREPWNGPVGATGQIYQNGECLNFHCQNIKLVHFDHNLQTMSSTSDT